MNKFNNTFLRIALIFFTLSLFAHPSSAAEIRYENAIHHQILTEDRVELNILELLSEDGEKVLNGPAILLVHGFTSNWNSWKYAAEVYRKNGYRVFIANWRGHGQGQYRSVDFDDSQSDSKMRFENLSIYDVPALVDFVSTQNNGQSIIYQGHSMGGMMAHLAFSGLNQNSSGQLFIDKKRIQYFSKKIAAFIPVASPLSLSTNDGLIGRLAEPLLSRIAPYIQINMDHEEKLLAKLPFAGLAHQAQLLAAYQALRAINAKGLINFQNITFDEFKELALYWGSKVPRQLSTQLAQMKPTGYGELASQIDYSDLSASNTQIPTLLMSPTDDSLALIGEQDHLTSSKKHVQQIRFENTGHVDILASKRLAQRVAELTLRFVSRVKFKKVSCEDALNLSAL